MSAVSMADIAIARKRKTIEGIGPGPLSDLQPGGGQPPSGPTPDSPVTAALKLITSYIPTEVLTLYVSGIAIFLPQTAGAAANFTAAWRTFWCFLVLTPIVNWIVYGIKLRAANLPLPLPFKEWPRWEMFTATVAFVFWAAALPSTPFASLPRYSAQLAGYLVLVTTTIFGLLSGLRRPSAS